MKIMKEINVDYAARQRINTIIDSFDKFYVSFSGGKDSGLLLNIVIEEARKKNKLPVDVLIVDFEAQYKHTVDFIHRIISRHEVNAYWICLPISLRNSLSQFQPKWICWNPEEKEKWLRRMPESKYTISNYDYFDFYHFGMEFEEFIYEFSNWYSHKNNCTCACLIAIRSDESLNRYKTIKNKNKKMYNNYAWTTKINDNVFNAYPIYDWKVEDIWVANGKYGFIYNKIYDLMYQAGVSLSQQRLCQPFGDDQRKGLWLYQILEFNTWQKLVERVAGCNFGARYLKNQGRIMGYYRFELPAGYTYKKYSKYLLKTMPPYLESHYRKRIYKFLLWWKKNGKKHGITRIPDYADKQLEASKKTPSWRRICKVLIKNDYWCFGLSFGQSKKLTEHYLELYNKSM
ncbi:DUF3440 domain-containing protein [Vibrio mimicus]|uniref:DUF3440 domain-containing protein n=1 Tax=Vibrio mimicus TaxID=674 RepID=UPI000878E1D6|nr:DUF3440 domain-containing protein [Vibrio mimicus]AOW82308.1 phosphoadenosine phosphosulfate reductase [Vibrio mimicus]